MSFVIGQVIQPSHTYTSHDGIPQIQILDIMQDQKGYIWVGTKRGVAKFDGKDWETFAEANKKGIHTIIENSNNEIILLPNQNGPSSFFKVDGNNLIPSKALLYGSAEYNTTYKNDTLFHLNVLESKLQRFDLVSMELIEEKEIDISKYILNNYSEQYGLVLLERTKGLERRYVSADNFELIIQTQARPNFLNVRGVGDHIICDDKNNRIDLYSLNSLEKIAEVYIEKGIVSDVKSYKPKLFFFSDGRFNYRISTNTGRLEKLNLINTTRNIFLEDRDGNLWNSSEGGVQFFPKTNFINYNHNGLNDAWFFHPYKDYYVYGNFSGGLKKVELDPLEITNIPVDKINRIYYDPTLVEDRLYIPGSSYISIFKDGFLEHIDIRRMGTQLLCSHYEPYSKQLFFGGLNSLVVLDQDNQLFKKVDNQNVLTKYILSIEQFGPQKLLVGTGSELAIFDIEKEEFKSLNGLFEDPNMAGAISLERDDQGNFWIGNNSGLWHFDVTKMNIKEVGAELIDDYVISLKHLKKTLAIGTNKELMYLDLESFYQEKEIKIKTFNYNNGFKGEEVGQNGFAIQDSILWIPTATSLISTNINNFDFDSSFTSLEIETVNNQYIDQSFENNEIYDLSYGVSDITIGYNAVGFNLPTQNQFQYKLEGHMDEWSNWTTKEEANFNQLASGEYKFIVKAKTGSSSVYGYPQASINLRVDRPFYKEPNFYKNAFALTMVLIGLIGLLVYLNYNRFLEKKEMDKQFKLLQVQTLQMLLNPHFLFNVLGSIQSLILAKDFENANKYLVSFSKMIRRYLDYNVSAFKSLQSDKKNAIKISLQEELDIIKIYLDFETLQLNNKFEYNIVIDKHIDKNEVKIPPLIIQPLLENAIKHGVVPKEGNSKINIYINEIGSFVKIEILDDGIGLARSAELQKESKKEFKSQSLELINQRVQVLNSMGEKITLSIEEKSEGVEQIITIKQTEN